MGRCYNHLLKWLTPFLQGLQRCPTQWQEKQKKNNTHTKTKQNKTKTQGQTRDTSNDASKQNEGSKKWCQTIQEFVNYKKHKKLIYLLIYSLKPTAQGQWFKSHLLTHTCNWTCVERFCLVRLYCFATKHTQNQYLPKQAQSVCY